MSSLKKNFFIKNKIVFLIIVRMGSKRLKNKAKLKINNFSLIEILLKKLLNNFPKKQIFICTSDKEKNMYLKTVSKKYYVNFFAGSEKNIFKRIIDLNKVKNFNHFVRITGDNPFTDTDSLNKMIKSHLESKSDYTYTNSLPVGTKAEVISFKALIKANNLAVDKNSSEYMTYFFKRKIFKRNNVKFKKLFNFQNNLHITIDTKKDLYIARKLFKNNSIFINNLKLIKKMSLLKKYFLKERPSKLEIKTNEYDVSFKNNSYNYIID